MNTRLHTIAALLIAGAALAATPALAADAVQGNRGVADKPVTRDAPFTLPGHVTAGPTPKVDTSTLSRGIFDEDEDAALLALGTVTFSRDGSVSETPVSDALRGIFENEMQGYKANK